jgi:hypothetical protein
LWQTAQDSTCMPPKVVVLMNAWATVDVES